VNPGSTRAARTSGPASAKAGAGRIFRWAAVVGVWVAGGALVGAAGPPAVASVPTRAVFKDAPPPRSTGGFGEATCERCHFGVGLNEAPGSFTIDGLPEQYQPGKSYTLSLTLTLPGLGAGGFQLSSRFEDSGAQAGSFASPGEDAERVGVVTDREVEFAHQRSAGTAPAAPDTARWSVLWTAPAAGSGTVLFHGVANAADGDESPFGDQIYTSVTTSLPHGP